MCSLSCWDESPHSSFVLHKLLELEGRERKKCPELVLNGNGLLLRSLCDQWDWAVCTFWLPFCYGPLLKVFMSPDQTIGQWFPNVGARQHRIAVGHVKSLECRAGRAQTFSCSGSRRWGWESAFLTSSQVVLLLPARTPDVPNHCRTQFETSPEHWALGSGTEYALNKYLLVRCI